MKQATRFQVQRGWKLLLRDLGVNPAQVLTLAGLPADLFSRVGASLSAHDYFNLWRGLEQLAGSAALPLAIGKAISVEAFDPPLFASLCSPNLNTALQRLAHFKRLIGPLTLTVSITDTYTELSLACYGHQGDIPRSLGAAELVFFTQLARLATRRTIVPTRVELAHVPDDVLPYEDYFGARVHAGQRNTIRFSADDAALPFLTEDAAMWRFFETELQQRLCELDAQASIAQRVRGALLEMLPAGLSSIDDAAKRLVMSRRSLQRHLSDEASNYKDILNSVRRDLAQHYLARSSAAPGEISYLLGFQDANSFIRAFKGWTGTTPSEYRREHATAAA